MNFVRLCAALALVGASSVHADDAADAAALVGSWDLVRLENHASDGSVTRPFGDSPVGRITYTADGQMSAHIMRAGRQPFAAGDLYGGSDTEKLAAYDGYVAYYGSFSLDSTQHVVTHHVRGSLFPNWVGGEQQRFYSIVGDELTLSTRPFTAHGQEVTAHVLWRRVR